MRLIFIALLSVFLVSCTFSMTIQTQNNNTDTKEFAAQLDQLLTSAYGAQKIFDTINAAILTPSPRLCWGCSLLFTTVLRYVGLHGDNIDDFIMKGVCPRFTGAYQTICNEIIDTFGSTIITTLSQTASPDAVCRALNVCNMTECNLIPPGEEPKVSFSPNWEQYFQPEPIKPKALSQELLNNVYTSLIFDVMATVPGDSPLMTWIEELDQEGESPLDWVKALITKVMTNHMPAVDFDADGFSEESARLRGYNWRGRDCNDNNAEVYPGRKTNPLPGAADYNCNGISGIDRNTAKSYKDLYCANSGQMGVVVMGDSAGAHAEIPTQWVDASAWDSYNWADLILTVANEVDLPHMSAYTGYADVGLTGPVTSVYKNLYQRNKCNFRDYQNIAVNGLASFDAQAAIDKLKRSQTDDHPVLVFLELVGNDVCWSNQTVDLYTTPDEFRANLISILNNLDTVLPAGSHLVTLGLANGSLIYEGVNGRMHPVGVTYNQLYDYQNCLGSSFCWGWLNTDASVRAATTQRAQELSAVYSEVLSTFTAKNFDFTYYDFPTQEIWDEWTGAGNDPYGLIEPVDGFHPNQVFHSMLGDYLWKALERDHPDWLGEENPYNDQITQQFGDQGGY